MDIPEAPTDQKSAITSSDLGLIKRPRIFVLNILPFHADNTMPDPYQIEYMYITFIEGGY